MVSVVCSNALHQSLFEFGLTDPADILNKTRELVIDTFAKSGDNVKDGMDISLCRIDKSTYKIKYAGANNPLWMKRKDSDEMIEFKADRQPVGLYAGMKPFTSKTIEYKTGDQFFMFTDGYADQFGGDKEKKLKYKPFRNLLLETATLPASEQQQKLETFFNDWCAQYEQIDDVCVIGVRL